MSGFIGSSVFLQGGPGDEGDIGEPGLPGDNVSSYGSFHHRPTHTWCLREPSSPMSSVSSEWEAANSFKQG